MQFFLCSSFMSAVLCCVLFRAVLYCVLTLLSSVQSKFSLYSLFCGKCFGIVWKETVLWLSSHCCCSAVRLCRLAVRVDSASTSPVFVSNSALQGDLVAVGVLSGNRNFEGRVHPNTRANYLASPPLVIGYAIAGTVRIDFEKEPLGKTVSGCCFSQLVN